MKKSDLLKIVLSFIIGLAVSSVVLLSVMIFRDQHANNASNGQVAQQSTQQVSSSDYSKQNIEENNKRADLQQSEKAEVTESEAKTEDTAVSTIVDSTSTTNAITEKNETTTAVQQAPKQSVTNTNKSANSTAVVPTQSKSTSTSSNTNTSSNTAKSTNTTNQVATQNNNTSSNYIVNKNTKVFHIPSCRSVKQMKDSNKMSFNGTRNEAISKGYRPCQNCNP